MAPAATSSMTGSSRGLGLVLALFAIANVLAYARRWAKGWGSLLVPIPAYNLVSLSDIEATMGRHNAGDDRASGAGASARGKHERGTSIEMTREAVTDGGAGAMRALEGSASKASVIIPLNNWGVYRPNPLKPSCVSEKIAAQVTPPDHWLPWWFTRKTSTKQESSASPIRSVMPLDAAIDPQFFGGTLLDDEAKMQLWRWLPARQQIREAKLVYSGEKHGYNLHTLYRMSELVVQKNVHKHGFETASLLLVKTSRKELIGAYTSTAWQHHEKYAGNGECFVFRAHPHAQSWHWSGGNDMMMLGGSRSLSIGCGAQPALWLDDELSHGLTTECSTFSSPPLTCQEPVMVLPTPPSAASQSGDGDEHPDTISQASFNCIAVELFIFL